MALTGKYAQLRDAIRAALMQGEIAEEVVYRQHGDGGPCNFDSPTLYLPSWKRELVEQAAKEAGTHCWKLSGDWWRVATLLAHIHIHRGIREQKTQKQCMTISNRWAIRQAYIT